MHSTGFRIRIVCLGLLMLALSGCGKPHTSLPGSKADLRDLFSVVGPGTSESLKRKMEVIRKGERRDAMVVVAPAVIRAALPGAPGNKVFRCWAAPVFNVGDGIQMNVFIRRSGTRDLVGSRYLDPARRAGDRAWILISIPIEVRGGDQLELEVSGGPQGDIDADWLALAGLELQPSGS